MKKGIKIDAKLAREYLWDSMLARRYGNPLERPDNWDPFNNYKDFHGLMYAVKNAPYPTKDWVIDCMVLRSCDYWDDRVENDRGYLNNLSYDGVACLLSGNLEDHVWGIYDGLKMHDAWRAGEEFEQPFFNAKERREYYDKYQQLQQLITDSEKNIISAQKELKEIKKKQRF